MAIRVFQAEWIRWLGVALLLGSACGGGARAQQDDAARRQYVAASDLQSRGDFQRAAEAWRKFLAGHKSDERIARAHHNLGVCCYQEGKYEQALAVFEKASADYPQSDVAAATQLYLGATQVALAQAGQRPMYDRAVATLRALLAKHPQGDHLADACYYLGECLSAQGKRQEAVGWYARLVEKYPNHRFTAEALYALAVAREESGDRAAAAKGYEQFLAKFPDHRLAAEARLSAGRCLHHLGNYAEAQKPLTKAVESGGTRAAEATHWLAQSLLKQKRPQQALAVLERIGPRGGDTSWAAQLLLDRADSVYALPERRKESIALYAEVAAKHPKDAVAPQALYTAGFMAFEAGDFAAAFRHAARFQAAYPDHALVPDALYVAAESNLQVGKLAEADSLYRQLVETYPSHADAGLWRVRRAALLHAQKKHEEVIRLLEPAMGELRGPESVAEARYLIGTSQRELKQPGAAIQSLTASLEAQPKWRQAFETCLALAEAYRDTGDLARAQATVRRAIAEFPESRLLDRAYSRLGAYHALAGQPDQAAEAYRQVIDRWPASPLAPYALHELGCAQLSLKDAAGAEATFNRLLEKPAPPALATRARYARAMARQRLGKPAEAVADLEAALAADLAAKDRSDARFLLGLCLTELKQYDKAAAAFRTLVSDDPKYAAAEKAVYQWAWSLKLAGHEAEANKAFAKLAAEYPQSPLAPEAQFHVAEGHFSGKDYASAAEAYYAVLEKSGRTPLGEKAAFQLALCYYRQRNFADAQKTFAYCRESHPDGPQAAEAEFMEAECLFEQGMSAEALAAYAKLKPSPNPQTQAAILLHAGQAAGKLQRWSEGIEWLDRLVRELPDSPALPDALCELGWAQQNLGKPAEAVAAYRQAIAKSDREAAARAQFLIGKIQADQNELKEAVKSFTRVVYGYSSPKWQADAAYEAARCLESLDQKPQAAAMYHELLDKFPKSDKAPPARKRLAEIKGKK